MFKLLHSTHNCIQSIQSSVVQDHTTLAYLKEPYLQLETTGEVNG
jgi:hypothetical protein